MKKFEYRPSLHFNILVKVTCLSYQIFTYVECKSGIPSNIGVYREARAPCWRKLIDVIVSKDCSSPLVFQDKWQLCLPSYDERITVTVLQ